MREDCFPGRPRPLPEAGSASGAFVYAFRRAAFQRRRVPGAVRHAAGYGPFSAAAAARGGDPRRLARDLLGFLAFLDANPDLLEDPAIRAAAEVFWGNAIALRTGHPAAAC